MYADNFLLLCHISGCVMKFREFDIFVFALAVRVKKRGEINIWYGNTWSLVVFFFKNRRVLLVNRVRAMMNLFFIDVNDRYWKVTLIFFGQPFKESPHFGDFNLGTSRVLMY